MTFCRALAIVAALSIATLWSTPLFAQTGGAVKLSIEPGTGEFIQGIEDITVALRLDTDGTEIDMVRIVLEYDTTLLAVVDADENEDGIQIEAGEIFPGEIENSVDESTGTIRFAQTAFIPDDYYTTETTPAVVAHITFNTLAEGEAGVTFVYDLEDEQASSAHVGVENVLAEVEDGIFTIVAVQEQAEPESESGEHIELTANLSTIPADGVSESQIVVTVTDADGLAVEGAGISVELVVGDATIIPLAQTTDSNGQIVLLLQASLEAGTQEIMVSLTDTPSVSASLSIEQEASVESEDEEENEEPVVEPEEEEEEPVVESQPAPPRLSQSGPGGSNALIALIGIVLLSVTAHRRSKRFES